MIFNRDGPSSVPVHVPGFLAQVPRIDLGNGAAKLAEATAEHLRGCGVPATVQPARGALFPCVHVRRASAQAKVSLLIPTRDRIDLLQPCIESLRRTLSFGDCEAIVIDNDSSDPVTLHYLEGIAAEGVRVLSLPGRFSFARLINGGAALASGEFLVAMSNSVKALGTGWLEEMLSRAVEPDIGAVGPTLLWPSGVVKQSGIVLGVGFAPSPAFGERRDGDQGYADQLIVRVSAAPSTTTAS